MKLIACLLLVVSAISLKAQKLEPTEDKVLVNIVVTDLKGKTLGGETVLLTAQKSKKTYQGNTDKGGKLSLLIPKGDTYEVIYKNITENVKYKDLTIPTQKGLFTFDVKLMFEPSKVIVLENVEYDFGKATLRSTSYKTLNDLAEYMKTKGQVEIEIAGHTDNKGSDDANMKLSQARAESVRNYLISKGIASNRIVAKGYGETKPIASNENSDGSDNPEGRQKNRRTEVKITKE